MPRRSGKTRQNLLDFFLAPDETFLVFNNLHLAEIAYNDAFRDIDTEIGLKRSRKYKTHFRTPSTLISRGENIFDIKNIIIDEYDLYSDEQKIILRNNISLFSALEDITIRTSQSRTIDKELYELVRSLKEKYKINNILSFVKSDYKEKIREFSEDDINYVCNSFLTDYDTKQIYFSTLY